MPCRFNSQQLSIIELSNALLRYMPVSLFEVQMFSVIKLPMESEIWMPWIFERQEFLVILFMLDPRRWMP